MVGIIVSSFTGEIIVSTSWSQADCRPGAAAVSLAANLSGSPNNNIGIYQCLSGRLSPPAVNTCSSRAGVSALMRAGSAMFMDCSAVSADTGPATRPGTHNNSGVIRWTTDQHGIPRPRPARHSTALLLRTNSNIDDRG